VVFVASGVVLAVLGIAGIVIGALLPSIVEGIIDDTVSDLLSRDVEDPEVVCTPDCEQTDKRNDYYIFNITNAKDVLGGAAPEVTQHKYSFTVYETDYNMDYDKSDDSIGYRSFSNLVPDDADAMSDEFITLNPVYMATAVGRGGSERGFYTAVIPSVAQTLVANIESFAAQFPLTLVPNYIEGILGVCIGAALLTPGTTEAVATGQCLAAFNAGSDPALIGTIQAVYGNIKTGMEAIRTTAYPAPIAATAPGWPLPTPIDPALLQAMFSTDTTLSLLTDGGKQFWVDGAAAAQKAQLTNDTADLVTWSNTAGGTLAANFGGATLNPADPGTIFTYIGKMSDSGFSNEVLSVTAILGDKQAADASSNQQVLWQEDFASWQDLAYMQFGSGAVLGEYNSIGSLGDPPAPAFEFYAAQGVSSSTFTISGSESKALLAYLAGDLNGVAQAAIFCGAAADMLSAFQANAVAQAGDGDQASKDAALSEYNTQKQGYVNIFAAANIGIDETNAFYMVDYACRYLPEEMFYKYSLLLDQQRDDGTSPTNTGLFIRRTVEEIMYGYNDALFTAVGADQLWASRGLVGPKTTTLAEAKAIDAALGQTDVKTRQKAGNVDPAELNIWVQVNGLKKLDKISDLGLDCPSPQVYDTGFASDCKLWGEVEQIEGVPDTKWPPFKEFDPVTDFEFYNDDLKRSVQVVKEDEEVELYDIRMVRYTIPDRETLSVEDAEDMSAEIRARAAKYNTPASGFLDRQRASLMIPFLLGFPRHNNNAQEAEKIKGKTPADWSTTTDDLTTYFDVEPLTGAMLNAHKRIQYNMLLEAGTLNGFYKDVVPASGHIIFPLMWFDDYGSIEEADAEDLREIWDSRATFGTVSTVAIIISVVNCVAGAALVFLGLRSDPAGELSNRG